MSATGGDSSVANADPSVPLISVPPVIDADAPESTIQDAVLGQEITSENDEVFLLVIAVLPVLLVIASIGFYRRLNLRTEHRR